MTSGAGGPGGNDPPPPKRRRRPPPGLDGFDTGVPASEYAPLERSTPTARDVPQPTEPTPLPGELPVYAAPAASAAGPPAEDEAPRGPTSADRADASGTPGASAPPDGDPAPPSATTATTAARGDDDPLAPPTFGSGALGELSRHDDARDDDDDLPGTPRSRKLIVAGALAGVIGLAIAATIFIGHQNSGWYYLTCETDRVVAAQGRAFPPWGTEPLAGRAWAPITIPPAAECSGLATESYPALVQQYRDMLVKRATGLLTAKEVTSVDEASALLEQALLHARANTDAARDARATIQRLLGDVGYWRASLKLRDAAKNLRDAANELDAAALQRPRHVTDAAAWATYVRDLADQLEAGPSGAREAASPLSPPSSRERPLAPPGVALPVEPDDPIREPEPPPQAVPDAGLPTGGVLL